MRNALRSLVVFGLVGWASQMPAQTVFRGRRAPVPRPLTVTASARVLSATGAGPSLEVSALLENRTTRHKQVVIGARCPLWVRLFPDPTGEMFESFDDSSLCRTRGPSLDIAPGHSATLTRVLRADTLTSFAPGTYGVNVAVTTNDGSIGAWAGTVQLPLKSSH